MYVCLSAMLFIYSLLFVFELLFLSLFLVLYIFEIHISINQHFNQSKESCDSFVINIVSIIDSCIVTNIMLFCKHPLIVTQI